MHNNIAEVAFVTRGFSDFIITSILLETGVSENVIEIISGNIEDAGKK